MVNTLEQWMKVSKWPFSSVLIKTVSKMDTQELADGPRGGSCDIVSITINCILHCEWLQVIFPFHIIPWLMGEPI